ncbi:MAG: ABC transporter permease [Ardenticatenaceae bacterium]|nr:ABC transporter permease [Ardenticatenaceae bacterium]
MERSVARKRPSLLTQLVDLTLIQLSNWRWSWRRMITTGMVAPVISLVALGLFARSSGPEALAYVFSGNIVLGLMFENLGKVSSNFSFMKAMGTLHYFATLPVHRYVLVLATVISFFIMSLPSTLLTIWIGHIILDVPLALHPLLLAVIPLVAIPLAALGALIGASARTPEEAGTITTLLIFTLTGLGPVVIPPSLLPEVMVWIGRFSPVTYAASALRQTLLGPVTEQLGWDMLVLGGVAVLSGWLVSRRMEWRQV